MERGNDVFIEILGSSSGLYAARILKSNKHIILSDEELEDYKIVSNNNAQTQF